MKYLILFVLVLLSGCTATQQQYAIDSGKIVVESAVLKTKYAEVESVTRSRKDIFSAEEWRKLQNVDATIDMLITKFDALVELDAAAMDISDVKFLWDLAATGYDDAREVMTAHWDEFPPSTQILLNAFDKQAQQTSERINDLLSNPNNAGVNESLTLILGTLTLAVKMITAGAVML